MDEVAEGHEAGRSDLASDLAWDAGVPVQERLPLDEPIPYRLTTLGRRSVAPGDVPALRVVGPDGHVDLDLDSGTARVRARALRRAGSHTLDIAEELGVEPLHVEAWVVDLPVPVEAGRSRRRRQLRVVQQVATPDTPDTPDASDARDASAGSEVRERARLAAESGREEAEGRLAREPGLRSGLGIVSGVLEPDPHALVLAGDQLPLLAAAWGWVRATLDADVGAARVLVRHEPSAAGDRIAHDIAAALGIEVPRVSTTRDASRAGRAPMVRLRCSDPDLAGRVLGWQRALLAEVARGAG